MFVAPQNTSEHRINALIELKRPHMPLQLLPADLTILPGPPPDTLSLHSAAARAASSIGMFPPEGDTLCCPRHEEHFLATRRLRSGTYPSGPPRPSSLAADRRDSRRTPSSPFCLPLPSLSRTPPHKVDQLVPVCRTSRCCQPLVVCVRVFACCPPPSPNSVSRERRGRRGIFLGDITNPDTAVTVTNNAH